MASRILCMTRQVPVLAFGSRPFLSTKIANTATTRLMSSSFDARPSPLRLPPEEQAEFERLQREAAESMAAAELADALREANEKTRGEAAVLADRGVSVKDGALPNIDTTSPTGTSGNPIEGVWRGAPPEFEGDRNPVTGEVGGPKNEPLRWGSNGDWSFNGRVTDF